MLAQEGYATARAGCTDSGARRGGPGVHPRSHHPHLQATDRATVMACLYGDPAAHALGYPPQGLTVRAGFALALSEARAFAR